MRRTAAFTVGLALVVAACSSQAGSTTTSMSTTTTSSSTTTVPSTTTTTLAPLEVKGLENDPGLKALVRDFYESNGRTKESPVYVQVSTGQVDEETRVAVAEGDDDVTLAVADPEWRIVGGWWPSLGEEPSLGAFPKIVAVIGSDARPGHDPLRSQADSIHFLGLDEAGTVSVLGLPRDSWLPVPGRGRMKITTSLLKGGPELTMEALGDATALDFDGYVLTGFEGFKGLIEVLGGLDIDVPLDLNDRWAKAYIDAGRQILSPSDALAFARVRKTIKGGDFTRQKHGGLALIAAAMTVQAMGVGSVPDLMEQAGEMYWTDLSVEDVLLLTATFVRADLGNATNVVAEGYVDTTSGGASIVRLRDSAYELFEDMADGHLDDG